MLFQEKFIWKIFKKMFFQENSIFLNFFQKTFFFKKNLFGRFF